MLKRRVQVNSSRIKYVSRPDATPEGELKALAAIFALILHRSSDREEASEPSLEPEDRKDVKPSPTVGAPSREGEA